MSLVIDRVAFLSGDVSGRNSPVRPPWSIAEFDFRSTCNSCGNCLNSCPTQIIIPGRGRMPQLSFEKGECTFCGNCVDSCETAALNRNIDTWNLKASIDESTCLAYQRVECRSCEDNCESRAIRFTARIGNVGQPVLNLESCTGCGACYSTCPSRAIKIKTVPYEVQQ
ncbi:MAG: ferredoxin-type protein NapF [Gammaproteobacteria bacterium]|nr:ferredoxin-type protein NapF [Gammaproteobacteria bacterium]